MAFERKDMTFALFPNTKGKSDKSPTSLGYVKIDGVEYELAGWTKTSQKGTKFVSGTVKPPEGYEPQKQEKAPEFDDEIPF